MALFNRKKTEDVEVKAEKKAAKPRAKAAAKKTKEVAVVEKPASTVQDMRLIGKNPIIRPHITEKATALSESHVYTFEVTRDANKIEIKKAIKTLYKVTPVSVRIVNKAPRHEVMARGRNRRPVRRPGQKKAYVTLKKGEQISFV